MTNHDSARRRTPLRAILVLFPGLGALAPTCADALIFDKETSAASEPIRDVQDDKVVVQLSEALAVGEGFLVSPGPLALEDQTSTPDEPVRAVLVDDTEPESDRLPTLQDFRLLGIEIYPIHDDEEDQS